MALTVKVVKNNTDFFTLYPVGLIDTNTSSILEQEIDDILVSKPKVIVLDLAGVTFLSSSGVRVVFKTKKEVESFGGGLIMLNLQPQIKKVFEIINAIPSLNIFANVQELDEYLSNMQRQEIDHKKPL